MKPFLSLICATLCTINVSAQTQPIYRLGNLLIEKHSPDTYYDTLQKYSFSYTGNRQGVAPGAQWVMGVAIYEGYDDSIDQAITGLQYDEAAKWYYPNGNTANGILFKNAQLFDAGGRITSFRQSRKVTQNGNTLYTHTDTMVYDGNGRLSYKKLGAEAESYHYNTAGMPDTVTHFFQTSVTQTDIHLYNGQGKPVQSIYIAPPDTTNTYYTYNTAGQNILTQKVNKAGDTVQKHTYAYDAGGNLAEHRSIGGIVGMHDNFLGELYAYDGKGRCTAAIQLAGNMIDHSIWDTIFVFNFMYNSFGLPETATQKMWDTKTQSWMDGYDYGEGWQGATRLTFSYYHVWPTAISRETAAANTLHIYPNPATNVLTVETTFDKAQPFSTTIQDMQGRTLRHWDEPAAASYHRTISLAGIPAGTYILNIGGRVERFVVQ